MAFLNLEQLLEPVSPEQPSGESLEYDATFIALESASRGKAEQQYGDNIIPAEPPDWPEVRRLGLQLSEQTRDLRVACFLARALLVQEGLEAFAEGMALVSGYLETFWDSVHPQLDPDDDNDPTFRVNTLASLNDVPTTVRQLRDTPLVKAGPIGNYSLVDLEIVRGEAQPKPDEEPPTMEGIEAAFETAGGEYVSAQRAAAAQILSLADKIEEQLTNQVGAAAAIAFDNLREAANAAHQALDEQCKRMGVYDDEPTTETEEVPAEEGDGPAATGTAAPAAAAPAPAVPQEITTREEVVRTLDKLCKYYERYEPSSPLPLLLKRAKRLASMSFLDIIKDLSPDALGQARAVGGFFDDMGSTEEAE